MSYLWQHGCPVGSSVEITAAGEMVARCTLAAGERVADGLVALWAFGEGQGTVARDSLGGLELTIEPAEAVHWIYGGGLEVAESAVIGGSGASICAACRATNEITVEAWIEPSPGQLVDYGRVLVLAADKSSLNLRLLRSLAEYAAKCRTSDAPDGNPSLVTAGGMAVAEKTHLVYTRAADGVERIYVNAEVAAEGMRAGDLSTWGDYALVLANESSADRPWLGVYELVAVYDRALTAAEVAQNYNPGVELPEFGTVEDAAWWSAGVPLNKDAAFYKYAQKHGMGRPVSVELDFVVEGVTYRGQAYNWAFLYCVVGDWGDIREISW